MIAALSTGFLTSFALILAIGSQNAFVLRQGILQRHVFAVSLTCALSDAVLIGLGVVGFGAMVALFPSLPAIMSLAGAVFLFAYGSLRFWASWRGQGHLELGRSTQTLRGAIATSLLFTWLNPHVYLDTLGLIGAVSTRFDMLADKVWFTIGAIFASFIFFFSLGYGAKFISPFMQSTRSWRILDFAVGVLMWALAASLIPGITA